MMTRPRKSTSTITILEEAGSSMGHHRAQVGNIFIR